MPFKDIWEAAREGDLLEVLSFVDIHSKPVDGRDSDQRTALHWAAAHGHNTIVTDLLSRGAQPDPTDEDGWSPLMSAVSGGKIDVVKVLLDTGSVDVNRTNDTGRAVMHYACSKGNVETVRLLMSKGARVNATDKFGNTPLHRACGNVSIAAASRDELVRLILSKAQNINVKNKEGETPLHVAVIEDNTSIALLLVESGADVLIENEEGKNSLELASSAFRDTLLSTARKMDKK